MYIHIYIYINTYTHTSYIYTYICTYIHTYTSILSTDHANKKTVKYSFFICIMYALDNGTKYRNVGYV